MPISRSDRERIAVTLGDPAGIGPEVIARALWLWHSRRKCDLLILGPARFFNDLAKRLSLKIRFAAVRSLPAWPCSSDFIPCYWPVDFPDRVVRGRPDPMLAKLALRSIETAARLALDRRVDAIVTSPINKASLGKAGFRMPGHTEYLAHLSGTKRFEMMLVGGKLRVVPITRHLAIRRVPAKIKRKRVEEAIALTDQELRRSFGLRRPRIVVCGLNPHAGEQGLFGREEIEEIAPAVASARKKTDAEIIGPLSPDALFHDAYRGRYDAEICMYHDQGLIPLKMISRGLGVNVTLGLPFVRTSPDHGTAYDIAGRFRADPGSMMEAMKLAVFLSAQRKRYDRSRR